MTTSSSVSAFITSTMWVTTNVLRISCFLAFLASVTSVPVKKDVNLLDSVYASDTQSVPPSEYVAYYYSSQDEKKHQDANLDLSDNKIPPVISTTSVPPSKIITNLFELKRSEERRPTEPVLSKGPEYNIPPEPKIEIVYAESMIRSENLEMETREKPPLHADVQIDSVIVSERTEIVTLKPSRGNQYLVVDSSSAGGNSISTSTSSGTQNSTFSRIPNVFLSADSAIWGGCALVLICSIIIIVLIYSKICRTGPYQE